ncbi:cation transporter [Aspergillus steynii IBT 23096]|uniref:Potassium transport protein n=1 Tax=Aspergillus steynii IBT 23096 TaxID=1392250 RepID=A0A2I2GBM4_9EURO|nr:cation transporter [Aspergillus steynii IBT 23096]PLB50276.1 cation transporter [Aspergillus steynii IBT 23096]
MWKPRVNFITLHYAYIIFLGILGLIILYPYGNLTAIDAYFFGVSASTESGLNPVDVNGLKTYQQLYIYFIPMLSNLCFINILVVVVRLHWFEKHLKKLGPSVLYPKPRLPDHSGYAHDSEAQAHKREEDRIPGQESVQVSQDSSCGIETLNNERSKNTVADEANNSDSNQPSPPSQDPPQLNRSISFADDSKALYIPPPRERDRGFPILEVNESSKENRAESTEREEPDTKEGRRSLRDTISSSGIPLEHVASSVFVIGKKPKPSSESRLQSTISLSKDSNLPGLSSQATLGRNSQFYNLTDEDREKLGGIEYRSLKILLKIVIGYFFGLHIFGAICLVGWIQYANPKYRTYLEECGQNHIWWAFYSAQTMVDNLGLTLTPDSMISFQDATFPMIVMSFLAYAGNTIYPCLLRLVIWTMFKCVPQQSSLKEPLAFLLKYPRRCYTLLFRSKPTWILFGIVFVLNFVDVLLIIVLDLHNPAVNNLPPGPRILAAIFQAASARHTGTSTFNLAKVNPAVQFSLLVMMYIAIFPIAISIRASNTYEESALGLYSNEREIDENDGTNYVLAHMRNQLSFDLWYIFLGIFCVCIAEADRIMDPSEAQSLSVFAVFFEVASAYGNVGLSLGYPTVATSLSGQFSTFSKVVICAMMIRGRHRGLPYSLDRAILLPNDRLVASHGDETRSDARPYVNSSSLGVDDSGRVRFRRSYTK